MELIQRLVHEWSQRACGLTIDIVGNSQLSSEVQWVIAAPVDVRRPENLMQAFAVLRTELENHGLQLVDPEHHDPAANLPNGTSLETTCPYRPDSCNGDHLVATGHGLVRNLGATAAQSEQQACPSEPQ